MTTTDARMAEIRARLEAATPGPWAWRYESEDDDDLLERPVIFQDSTVARGNYYIASAYLNAGRFEDDKDCTADNAALIAAAPSDLAYLLDGLARVEAQRDAARAEAARLREALEDYADDTNWLRSDLITSDKSEDWWVRKSGEDGYALARAALLATPPADGGRGAALLAVVEAARAVSACPCPETWKALDAALRALDEVTK